MKTTEQSPTKSAQYENNPFFVATNGLELLFSKAKALGILIAVLVGLRALTSLPSLFVREDTSQAPQQVSQGEAEAFWHTLSNVPVGVWVVVALVVLAGIAIALAIGIVIRGILDYTAAQLAAGKTTTISEAFRAVFKDFWGYTWVLVIAGVKTFLWTLLFVIPGIVMSFRYSLAGVAYFDKKLKGDASVKHSSRLVKGAWLTTAASQTLLNLLTLGAISPLLMPGTNAVLYRQLEAAGTAKPKAHVLSWLTLIIPIVFALFILFAVFMLLAAFANYQASR